MGGYKTPYIATSFKIIMLHIIARIIETVAVNRATRESKAHAQRKAQRKAREAYAAEYAQAQRGMRQRHPYPFHQ